MSMVRKMAAKRKYIFGVAIVFISVLIIISTIWGNKTFPVISFDQVVFHLKVPMEGTDAGILWHWIFWCIPISLIVTAILIISIMVLAICFDKVYSWIKKRKLTSYCLTQQVTEKCHCLSIVFLICSLVFVFINYSVYGYFTSIMQKTSVYESHYVDPRSVNISFPDKKRNLIHIYLESIENTFLSAASGGAFKEGYAKELEELANTYINFSHIDGVGGTIGGNLTIPGTGWTAAAMVAHSAGIPLTLPINSESYGKNCPFLPGAYGIGEVLQREGYQQKLLLGSDADFGGRSNFYKQHGDYDIVDIKRLKEQGRLPEDYHVFWGFEDEKLFAFAKEEILELAKGDAPFNMTMLTVDAHTPQGYLSESCATPFSSQYENVIACQSSQVYQFVNWIQQQDFYEDTTVVITGDHTSMANWFFENIESDFIRTTYNVVINSPIEPKKEKNRLFAAMDWYPTILAAMGAEIEGDRLGLGTNLFSEIPTLKEKKGLEYLTEELQKTSDFYNNYILKKGD